jgi:hypothetical protein
MEKNTMTDKEILQIATAIARSFRVVNIPTEELINEGFIAAKEALLANADNPSYRYAISKRIKGSLIDFINSSNHKSLPSDIDGSEYEVVDDYTIEEDSSTNFIVTQEAVNKLIRLCPFYEETRTVDKPLVGRGMEFLWDRFVLGMTFKAIGQKYGVAPQTAQVRAENLLFQLRVSVSTLSGRIKQ